MNSGNAAVWASMADKVYVGRGAESDILLPVTDHEASAAISDLCCARYEGPYESASFNS